MEDRSFVSSTTNSFAKSFAIGNQPLTARTSRSWFTRRIEWQSPPPPRRGGSHPSEFVLLLQLFLALINETVVVVVVVVDGGCGCSPAVKIVNNYWRIECVFVCVEGVRWHVWMPPPLFPPGLRRHPCLIVCYFMEPHFPKFPTCYPLLFLVFIF